MERLTKRDESTGSAYFPRCFDTCGGIGCVNAKCNEKFMAEVCQRLADYEDAEERGETDINIGSKWISVEDRLPDMCGLGVLACAINKFGQTAVFTVFTGYMERGRLEFHSCEPIYADLTSWKITHWRPLPPPPTKGQDE